MARNQKSLVLNRNWQEITNSDAENVSFQATSGDIEVRRGTTDTPAATENGWFYEDGYGERNLPLSDLASAAGTRVYARAAGVHNTSTVLVDHA